MDEKTLDEIGRLAVRLAPLSASSYGETVEALTRAAGFISPDVVARLREQLAEAERERDRYRNDWEKVGEIAYEPTAELAAERDRYADTLRKIRDRLVAMNDSGDCGYHVMDPEIRIIDEAIRGAAMRSRDEMAADKAVVAWCKEHPDEVTGETSDAWVRLVDDHADLLAAIERVEAVRDEYARGTNPGVLMIRSVVVERLTAALTGDQEEQRVDHLGRIVETARDANGDRIGEIIWPVGDQEEQ